MEKVIKFVTKWVKHFIPQPLPIGMTEFDNWSQEIIANYDLPNNDSMKFTLATMIMHMDHGAYMVPYGLFAARIKKAMANQIAGAVFQEVKAAQAAKAEEEAKKAENVEVPVSPI